MNVVRLDEVQAERARRDGLKKELHTVKKAMRRKVHDWILGVGIVAVGAGSAGLGLYEMHYANGSAALERSMATTSIKYELLRGYTDPSEQRYFNNAVRQVLGYGVVVNSQSSANAVAGQIVNVIKDAGLPDKAYNAYYDKEGNILLTEKPIWFFAHDATSGTLSAYINDSRISAIGKRLAGYGAGGVLSVTLYNAVAEPSRVNFRAALKRKKEIKNELRE